MCSILRSVDLSVLERRINVLGILHRAFLCRDFIRRVLLALLNEGEYRGEIEKPRAFRLPFFADGCDDEKSPICHVLFPAYEDFDASIYNALTGYYRVAFSSLRNVVENFTIALQLELSGDGAKFQSWIAGNVELHFREAEGVVLQIKAVCELEAHFKKAGIADNLFRKRKTNRSSDPGGFSRRLFGKLSKYTHGVPGFTDGDMSSSNGPVFVPKAFDEWSVAFVQAYCFCLIACHLAHPKLRGLGNGSKSSLEGLFKQAANRLGAQDDGAELFQNLPVNFW
jgi:hypothetical protein